MTPRQTDKKIRRRRIALLSKADQRTISFEDAEINSDQPFELENRSRLVRQAVAATKRKREGYEEDVK